MRVESDNNIFVMLQSPNHQLGSLTPQVPYVPSTQTQGKIVFSFETPQACLPNFRVVVSVNSNKKFIYKYILVYNGCATTALSVLLLILRFTRIYASIMSDRKPLQMCKKHFSYI